MFAFPLQEAIVPRPGNALLRRYARRLGSFTPGQFFVLILLGLPCAGLVGEHLRDLGERSRSAGQTRSDDLSRYRPGIDFYEAERRAAERTKVVKE